MSSYSTLADALSRIEEQRGNALARGAEQRGQIWGNAIGGLGSLIAGIPEQRARLAEAQQRQQIGQLELQKAQGAQQAQSALDLAMQHAVTANPDGTYSPNRDLVRQELTGKGFAHVLPALEKSWAESDKITAEGREAKQKVARGEAEDVAAMATRGLSLLDSGVDPSDVAGTLLPDIAAHTANGVIERPHGDAITSQIGAARSDPKALRTLLQGWQQASKEQMEGVNAKAQAALRNAEAPGAAAKSAVEQQVAAGTINGISPEQQAINARADAAAKTSAANIAADNARADQQLAISRGQLGVAQAREKREGLQAAAGGDDMGIGSDVRTTATGQKYVDLSKYKGKDYHAAQQQAKAAGVYGASASEVDALQNIDTARQNMALIAQNLNKLPSSATTRNLGSGLVNKAEAYLQTDPALASWGTWRTAAIQAMRALAGSKGLRINRSEIEASMENDIPNITDTQATAAEKMRRVDQMLGNQEKGLIGSGNASAPAAASAPAGRVRVVGPNGETGTVPKGAPLPKGWTAQ